MPASPFSIDAARAWKRRREAMIAEMAQRLIEDAALRDRTTAGDCLLGRGYGRHVVLLLDQAMAAADAIFDRALDAVAAALNAPDEADAAE
ncbi:hypothetical protein [Bradyrhizobium sp. SZCCHNRI2007]|uniref:hypothetical protein n=1 Tax=Bradyrhizobium sp. SZCCHNRI2007 TaxID=3057281 RepID=UPI0028E482D2|nr:hypothetical protein [Bradyrhizobium sp. SZCCHNRI2007]